MVMRPTPSCSAFETKHFDVKIGQYWRSYDKKRPKDYAQMCEKLHAPIAV